MKSKISLFRLAAFLLFTAFFVSSSSAAPAPPSEWKPEETAIIVCDMWDRHWCKHLTARVAELAPVLNDTLIAARQKGVTIIHAPSETLKFYKDHPARKKALAFRRAKNENWARLLPEEKGVRWPLDTADQGCPECKVAYIWKRQIETIFIADDDFISESRGEILGYLEQKKIKNVALSGVATNMCVIGRPFGLRSMKMAGKNVVLIRDLSDVMYNNVPGKPKRPPYVSHDDGQDIMVAYIEKYVCPSITSTVWTGKPAFQFASRKTPSPVAPDAAK
jgi:nicotinamidase-related amidase